MFKQQIKVTIVGVRKGVRFKRIVNSGDVVLTKEESRQGYKILEAKLV
jgi:hypothetical protein